MSGTLEITNEVSWLPAGWVFDRVLEKIAGEVSAEDPELAELLLQSRTERTGYCDLRAMDEARFAALTRAAMRARLNEAREGHKEFQDPRFFTGFMHRFNELIESLCADPRTRSLKR